MTRPLILVGRPTLQAFEPLRIWLQKLGYVVHVVDSGAEAIKLMDETAPHAVFVDIATPEIRGVDVCESIRRASRTTTIVAINQGENARRHSALKAGADLVLDEPLNWSDIQNWLAAPRAANGQMLAEGALLGLTQEDNIGSAALLAHDLKSPVSVVISSLEVLLAFADDDRMPETTKRLLQGALSAAYRQLNMVNNIVDLARLEMGCYDLQLVEIDLVEAVHTQLANEHYSLEVKGLQVKIDLPEEPVPVRADIELIHRIISAITDSVIKFTVRDDEFHVSLYQQNGQAVIRFKDTGRAIDKGFEYDIMTRAPQWERRQAGARTSVGLSLPFVYAVAQAHEGDFTAKTDGKYTIFTFTLPTI